MNEESYSRDQIEIAALDAIGFDWRGYIEQWPEKHGHISLEKNMIGACNIIGVQYKRKVTVDQISALDVIGFDW